MRTTLLVATALLAASTAGCSHTAPLPGAPPRPATTRPDSHVSFTLSIAVSGPIDEAVAFYERAFDATQTAARHTPDGTLVHAEITIGTSVMLIRPEPAEAPDSPGGSLAYLTYRVDDADAIFARAVAAGAIVVTPVEDQLWGDRHGMVADPYGHHWAIVTHTEELTLDELLARAQTVFGGSADPVLPGRAAARPVAERAPTITPTLLARDASMAIEWYKAAFGATERARLEDPHGRILHAEVQIGDVILVLCDELLGPTPPSSDGADADPASYLWGLGGFGAPAPPGGLATHRDDLTPEQLMDSATPGQP